jgi:hypothetical protein
MPIYLTMPLFPELEPPAAAGDGKKPEADLPQPRRPGQ